MVQAEKILLSMKTIEVKSELQYYFPSFLADSMFLARWYIGPFDLNIVQDYRCFLIRRKEKEAWFFSWSRIWAQSSHFLRKKISIFLLLIWLVVSD